MIKVIKIMNRIVIAIVCLIGAAACNNNTPKATGKKQVVKDSSVLGGTDSLQVLYYNEPDGDSLRYTRFFRFTDVSDTATIRLLLQNVQQAKERREQVKPCRSEGKIYAYRNQEPVKTVYFSTRCDTCCYLYYIKDGAFYYHTLSSALRSTLTDLKKQSREP
jgi:hypothetical protein